MVVGPLRRPGGIHPQEPAWAVSEDQAAPEELGLNDAGACFNEEKKVSEERAHEDRIFSVWPRGILSK